MAKCPACERDVATPFFMNTDAWRWLACPHCAAKLERKSPRYLVALSSFMLALIALGGLGHRYRIISSVLLARLDQLQSNFGIFVIIFAVKSRVFIAAF